MESVVPCKNVHTGLRQRQGPEPIVSYCACPIPCSGWVLVACNGNKPWERRAPTMDKNMSLLQCLQYVVTVCKCILGRYNVAHYITNQCALVYSQCEGK